MELSRYQY